MTIFGGNGQLESVHAEHDAAQGHDRWDQVDLSVIVLGHQVVTREAPQTKGDDLVEDDSCIDKWVEGNSLGSTDGPSKEWISQNAVDE
jgi:hypothetical protein